MKVIQFINGKALPATPIRRYVNLGHNNPGLSFTHPADQPANWHVIIPLGAQDFYQQNMACPTFPGRGDICRYCGTHIVDGVCSGQVPLMPSTSQRYTLVPLRNESKDGSAYLAAKEKPGDEKGCIVLWDDYKEDVTAIGYAVEGSASIIAYGHDNDAGQTLLAYPVVQVTGPATLIASGVRICEGRAIPTMTCYQFDETGYLGYSGEITTEAIYRD